MVDINPRKTTPLRWGFLSTARINRALIEPLNSSERNSLLAVGGRSRQRAEEFAQKWNIPRAYGTYQDLLDDPDIDVIYNSLPNSLHAEWTVKAVRAGKHVLCEKPLAVSLSEVDEIADASQKSGRFVAEAFMYRHHPQTILAKELIDRGEVGEVRLVKGAFTFNLTKQGDIRLNKSLGGGCLWDVGCYPVSFTRFILGREPAEVFGWQITGDSGVDEAFTGQMRFDSDPPYTNGTVLAQFDSGFRSRFRASMEIVGSEGTLLISDPFKPDFGAKLILERESGIESILVPDQGLYFGEVEDMANAVLINAPPRISLADSRANVRVILALLESARVDATVRV